MKFHALVCAAAAVCGFASIGNAQSESSGSEEKAKGHSVLVQEGSARAPDRFGRSESAQALQEVARMTVEASLAFDRGEDETGRARARSAADRLKSIEVSLAQSGTSRARSKLAEQRGRLQLEFLGCANYQIVGA